jgi:hypothetical protein
MASCAPHTYVLQIPLPKERKKSFYLCFSSSLLPFAFASFTSCYCVNGKWVFASWIKLYSVSICFLHAPACLTRQRNRLLYVSVYSASKEWTLGKNNNKNNSKATLVMTSNRKIRDTKPSRWFLMLSGLSLFLFVLMAKLRHPLVVVLENFFYRH